MQLSTALIVHPRVYIYILIIVGGVVVKMSSWRLMLLSLVLLSCFTTEGRKETAYKRGTLDPVPKRSHRHSKH